MYLDSPCASADEIFMIPVETGNAMEHYEIELYNQESKLTVAERCFR